MKLLLDELWPPVIAEQLRKCGVDVADYEQERSNWERDRATPHYGVVYAVDPPFDRHKSGSVVGRMVRALDHLLQHLPAGSEPLGRAHWLRPAPSDFD